MYRKNTASQFIYFGLVNASTGAALTGATVSVRRCLDGTFAAGGGTVTEDAGGLYKYAFAQADTNGNDCCVYFTATSAIPVEKTFVTTAADPTDGVRFGLTSLPNAVAAAIGGLLTAPTTANVGLADLSRILGTALTETAGQIAGAFKKFFNIATPASTMDALTLVATATSVTNAPTAGDFTAAMKTSLNAATLAVTVSDKTGFALTAAYDLAKTAAQAGDAMALTTGERNSTADALLNRDMSTGTDSGSTTVRTVRQALRPLRNKVSIVGSTMTVCKEDDSTASHTAALTTDATANPITVIDPAGP